jgi:class 3 adenylate cyclase
MSPGPHEARRGVGTNRAAFFDGSLWRAVRAFCSPVVSGRPRWYARYLAQGVCRLKWLSAVGIVLFLLQATALSQLDQRLFVAAAAAAGATPRLLVWCSVAVGIAGAIVVLAVGRNGLTFARARRLVRIGVVFGIAAEVLLVAFSHAALERMASLDIVLLALFAIAPLELGEAALILAGELALLVVAAGATGMPLSAGLFAALIHPASMGAIGLVVNRWYRGVFKADWLASVRLDHRTRQLETQKRQIEQQKDDAVRQRGEIARQQAILLHALASALTEPVARAYVRDGAFRTELKSVCVIACDAVGFSETCRKLQSERIVEELGRFFRAFDAACLEARVEPLRAQGDSRIAIAGLWPGAERRLHQDAIGAVLAMLLFRRSLPSQDDAARGTGDGAAVLWPARIGISLGSVACGIIDTGSAGSPQRAGRLWFDVWGDTVNLAARLQEAAKPNQILVREGVLWETCGLFDHGPIQRYQVKSTILSDAAEIVGIRAPYRDDSGLPNAAFWERFNDVHAKPQEPDPAGTLTATQ